MASWSGLKERGDLLTAMPSRPLAYHPVVTKRLAAFLLLAIMVASAPARAAEESFRYRWKLDGFVGALAALFMPSRGEGLLSVVELPDGTLRSELEVTSKQSRSGEFFRYGAEWDPATGRTVRAWSEQLWRGEQKSKKSEVDQVGVIDVVSGIYVLRLDPPTSPRRLEIWSDGRLYPVLVLPRGIERRTLAGQAVNVRRLSVRGVAVPGRKVWKGELDFYIADDAKATPVEIVVSRTGAHVRLTIIDTGEAAGAAAEGDQS